MFAQDTPLFGKITGKQATLMGKQIIQIGHSDSGDKRHENRITERE